MEINIDYKPNKKQALFHMSDADEVVYGGAKGGGKSCALVMESFAYAMEHEFCEVYLFRETYDDLEANLIREFKMKIPNSLYTYKEAKHDAVLINGSVIKFRHIGSYQDSEHYQGRSIDFIGVDELTKHEERSIQNLLSCLRSIKGYPPRFRGTCNPGGVGHNWVKSRYITATSYGQEVIEDEVTGNKLQFIPARVTDNTVLMENDPNYIRRLENLPEAQKKAFLYGDWDIFEGQYFNEFKSEHHIIKPFEIPSHWRRFRSLDYGLDMTACHWWAVDEDNRCYVYRELHEPNLILSKAALRIIEMTPQNENIQYTVASPDLWNRRQDTGESGVEIMARNGLTHLIKANNKRVPGWRTLREYLSLRTDRYGNQKPSLQFFNNCKAATGNIPLLQHDKVNPEDCADNPHEITHAPESIRYGIMSRPLPKQLEVEVYKDPFDEPEEEVMLPEVTDDYIDYFNDY